MSPKIAVERGWFEIVATDGITAKIDEGIKAAELAGGDSDPDRIFPADRSRASTSNRLTYLSFFAA